MRSHGTVAPATLQNPGSMRPGVAGQTAHAKPEPASAHIGDVVVAGASLTPASERPSTLPTGALTRGTDVDVDEFSRVKRRAGRWLEAKDDREHTRVDLLLPFIG